MKHCTAPKRQSACWSSVAGILLLGAGACAPTTGLPADSDLPGREPTVRVGLAVDTSEVTLGSTTALEIVDAGTRDLLFPAPTATSVTVEAAGQNRLTARGSAAERTVSGVLLARPTGQGFIQINGKAYRGTAMIRPTATGGLTVINEVGMENYLLGVVPYEIGRVGPELLEASKAQAVAARTYAVRYLGRRESLGFDVFATVSDQVYGGAEGEHEPVSRAVLETAGEILTYDGEPIEAFYHSTCAGRTAAIEEVWPTEQPRPYLVSVSDVNPATGEAFDVTSNRFTWTQRWTAEELGRILNKTLADSLPAGVSEVGDLRDFEVLERTPSGRIARMRITTSNGTFHVGRDQIRWTFLTPEERILNSSMFDIVTERDAQGRITAVEAQGGGWGHGIGMCQVGAMGRARAGQEYRTILRAYYPGTEITKLY